MRWFRLVQATGPCCLAVIKNPCASKHTFRYTLQGSRPWPITLHSPGLKVLCCGEPASACSVFTPCSLTMYSAAFRLSHACHYSALSFSLGASLSVYYWAKCLLSSFHQFSHHPSFCGRQGHPVRMLTMRTAHGYIITFLYITVWVRGCVVAMCVGVWGKASRFGYVETATRMASIRNQDFTTSFFMRNELAYAE